MVRILCFISSQTNAPVCRSSHGAKPLARIDGGGETRIWRKKLWQIFPEFLGEALSVLHWRFNIAAVHNGPSLRRSFGLVSVIMFPGSWIF